MKIKALRKEIQRLINIVKFNELDAECQWKYKNAYKGFLNVKNFVTLVNRLGNKFKE